MVRFSIINTDTKTMKLILLQYCYLFHKPYSDFTNCLTNFLYNKRKIIIIFLKDLPTHLREREHEWEGQRERGKENPAEALLSVEPNVGLHPTTLRSGPKPKPRVGCTTNCTTQAPQGKLFFNLGSSPRSPI